MWNKKRLTEISLAACFLLGSVAAPYLIAQQQDQNSNSKIVVKSDQTKKMTDKKDNKVEVANFGAGCFWCVEAVFQELKGVKAVESGYMGGTVENPSYDAVCSGTTGHAEICRVKFDPEVVSFKELLEVFWKTHDPTTLNRQGADAGTQYRSAVFYTSTEQKELAEKYKKKLNSSGAFSGPIVTEVSAASTFYSAGDYHANYYRRNPNGGYCQAVVRPKLDKFRRAFAEKLKQDK